jgi:hypothetical protein
MLGELNYYIRNHKGVPVVSVGLVIRGDQIARGISMYRPEPHWSLSKKWGTQEAYTRAWIAMSGQFDHGILKADRNKDPFGEPNMHPVNYFRKHERLMKLFRDVIPDNVYDASRTLESLRNLSSIDLVIANGLGVWESEDVLRIYRGVLDPLLTNKEMDCIFREWKNLIFDIDKFFEEYCIRAAKRNIY